MRSRFVLCVSLSTFAVAVLLVSRPAAAQLRGAVAAEVNLEAEAMLRGPIHEAFAELIRPKVEPTLIVHEAPPEPIPEIPPEIKPEGEDVIWISGYWVWDEERDDYIWVSGVWRAVPPDRRWVPGYWHQVADGYQWVPGFWADTTEQVVEYLPPPPESLDRGPTSPAPSQRHYWVNGYWVHYRGEYYWRPGTWAVAHDGWMWQPAHYVWTPRGAVFVNGYWDYPFARRGQLFAPVYFANRSFRPGYMYSPSVVVNTTNLIYHLFVRPSLNHYYWGDFYGPRYSNVGWYTWTDYYGRYGYDPLFSYYRADYSRQGRNFDREMGAWYRDMARYEDRRPPRNLAEQLALAARAQNDPQLGRLVLANTITNIIQQPQRDVRFQRISGEQRQSFRSVAQEVRELVQQRQQTEAQVAAEATAATPMPAEADVEATAATRKVLKLPETSDLRVGRPTRQPPAEKPVPSEVADDRATAEDAVGRGERGERRGVGASELGERRRGERGIPQRPRPDDTATESPTGDREAGAPLGERMAEDRSDDRRPEGDRRVRQTFRPELPPDPATGRERSDRPVGEATRDLTERSADAPDLPAQRAATKRIPREVPDALRKTPRVPPTETPGLETDRDRVTRERTPRVPDASARDRGEQEPAAETSQTPEAPTVGTDGERVVPPNRRTTMPQRSPARDLRAPTGDLPQTRKPGTIPSGPGRTDPRSGVEGPGLLPAPVRSTGDRNRIGRDAPPEAATPPGAVDRRPASSSRRPDSTDSVRGVPGVGDVVPDSNRPGRAVGSPSRSLPVPAEAGASGSPPMPPARSVPRPPGGTDQAPSPSGAQPGLRDSTGGRAVDTPPPAPGRTPSDPAAKGKAIRTPTSPPSASEAPPNTARTGGAIRGKERRSQEGVVTGESAADYAVRTAGSRSKSFVQ